MAAVYYLLGEAFDQDPFLIFRMRGSDREELTALLIAEGGADVAAEVRPAPQAAPLSVKPQEFWESKPAPVDLLGNISLSRPLAALPQRLGNLQFWRGESPLAKALEPSYRQAVNRAEQLLSEI